LNTLRDVHVCSSEDEMKEAMIIRTSKVVARRA
jgi:hypothetical protein